MAAPARPRPRLRTALVALALLTACGRDGRGSRSPDGQVSDIEANRYIRRAIRSSSEGVILLPSQRAERVYELPRLNEIAQGLCTPAARCFLRRAIETMEPRTEGERGYHKVPEGQLKARVRIAPSGEVLRAEVLESGFTDEQMEPCLQEVLEGQRWPPNKSGNAHFVDVVYWVSLGMQRANDTPEMATRLRREQIGAGVRAKACLQGRLDAGRYEIGGLNLVDREGATMVNRVDTDDLPEPIRACIATALREIRLPRDPDAFVRPISPRVVFEITRDGTVSVEGEQWLELVELEERARLAAERGALTADQDPDQVADELPTTRPVSEGAGLAAGVVAASGGAEDSPTDGPQPVDPPALPDPEATPESPAVDPAEPGLRLDLGGRGRSGDR